MNKSQMSEEQVDAVEKAMKGKLPFLFIVLFAAVCAWLELASPATTYGGHFIRLAFFGWFSWTVCRMLEEIASRSKNEAPDDIEKST